MHEKILQGVTIGVVAGLLVYWLTTREPTGDERATGPGDYKPLLGDVRTIRFGSGTCACCQCCGLIAPENTTIPLAADYLCCAPDYAPAISKWNLGVSLQLSCEGIDLHSGITRKETATSFPYDLTGKRTTPTPVIVVNELSCSPNIPISVCCTEVV